MALDIPGVGSIGWRVFVWNGRQTLANKPEEQFFTVEQRARDYYHRNRNAGYAVRLERCEIVEEAGHD